MTTSVADERSSYSVAQAAARIGVSRVTLWRWISAGRVPVLRLGHRTARIRHADLQHLLQPSPLDAVGLNGHAVQFYDSDEYLLDTAAGFLGAALRAGQPALVVATPLHREGMEERLRASGLDTTSGLYQSLDAETTLCRFMVDGSPDPHLFRNVIGGLVREAHEQGQRLRIFGEMVALLAAGGEYMAAVKLEQLWNDLQHEFSFALLCAYPIAVFGGEELGARMGDVCGAHGNVFPAESFARLADDATRLREVADLQQKARSLEHEVARRRRVEDQLRVALAAEQQAREAAEAALNVRDEFVSIASHELKTPLTTLSGYAQLALRRFNRDGELEPERVVQALEAINSQADKLGRLLGHLLDIARLEEGKLALDRSDVDLSELVADVVATARGWSDKHAIALELADGIVASVDVLRLEQVLTNLLDNAMKYSPRGGQIDVVLRQRASLVEVSVRDRGLGIPRARRAHIFERFYQAHHAGHRSGLGLGLFISRQIVELHGGTLRAEFPRGGGTRFVLRLPVQS